MIRIEVISVMVKYVINRL